jgi:hypothetical protein
MNLLSLDSLFADWPISHPASGTQGHQGNFRYRSICHKAATWYHSARGNANLKRAIVHKVIKDVEPGRFLKFLPDGSCLIVEGKERYTKVQTDLRTGRIGRMMNKTLDIPKDQVDAAVAALSQPSIAPSQPMAHVPQSVHAARPGQGNAVTRTVSTGEEQHLGAGISPGQAPSAVERMKLEAEYLELTKQKEMLLMRNKILELKKDLQGLRAYNQQLESGEAVPNAMDEVVTRSETEPSDT